MRSASTMLKSTMAFAAGAAVLGTASLASNLHQGNPNQSSQ
jgi:hypothetical protein